MSRETATEDWYQSYYRRLGAHRNDLRLNRGVLFQTLAMDASLVRAAYGIEHSPETASVLDVGCGAGAGVTSLARLRYEPCNYTGIDVRAEQIDVARRRFPNARFIHGDASQMQIDDGTFDLVYESTMFATLPDEELSASIAREMVRVCRAGGYLLLIDWRTWRPLNRSYRALTRSRVRRLFGVGEQTRLMSVHGGALVPPLGRFLSHYVACLYFLVSSFCPPAVGQVAYLLQKSDAEGPCADAELARQTQLPRVNAGGAA